MVADANIFAQFLKAPPSAMDYAERFAASDMAQQQNALARLTMQEKADALAEQNRLKQLYMQNPNITADQLRQSGFRNEALNIEKSALEKRKTETEIGYKEAQTSKEQVEAQAKAADAAYNKTVRHAQNIAAVQTPEDIIEYVDAGIRDGVPGFTPEMRQKAIENFQRLGSVEAWKKAATEGAIPVLERYKQEAEDARAALKASLPDYAILDSSTGVVGVDKRTLKATPVTYGSAATPPQVAPPAAGGLPSGAPSGAPVTSVKPVTPGNIDLNNRPVVKNADGSVSTVRSMSVNFDGKEVLIPTVSDDGRVLSDEAAIQQYLKTGKHLGIFNTPEEATAYAKSLHDAQANRYARPGSSDRYISPETQRARDDERLIILKRELQKTTDPADRAAIEREIGRVQGTAPQNPTVANAGAPSAPVQVQPRQKDPGQPFAGVDAAGPGMFQMINGKPVRVEGLGQKEDAIPASVNKSYIENRQSAKDLDRAINLVANNPKALGPANYIPGSSYFDPKGVEARAAVANVGSLLVHDRSGAAVTVAEMPRLAPFIPAATDPPDVALKKLRQLKQAIDQSGELMIEAYPGLGKRNSAKSGSATSDNSKLFSDADAILRGGR
jgi:hypothetical protein